MTIGKYQNEKTARLLDDRIWRFLQIIFEIPKIEYNFSQNFYCNYNYQLVNPLLKITSSGLSCVLSNSLVGTLLHKYTGRSTNCWSFTLPTLTLSFTLTSKWMKLTNCGVHFLVIPWMFEVWLAGKLKEGNPI